MARNQKNFTLFAYVDNNGVTWNKRGEDGGAGAAVDGHAAFDPTKAVFPATNRRWQVRRIIYTDPTTFRKIFPIFYTAAAWAAVALGDIVAVQVPGLATTVNYTATRKLPEKQPSRSPQGAELPD